MHLRAAICGVSTAVSWLFNFLVAEVTPVGFATLKWKYFFVYMCTNAAAGLTVYFFCEIDANNGIYARTDSVSDPETAGRTLEEIDEIFTASKSIFDPVRIAKNLPKQHLSTFLHEEAKNDPEVKENVKNIESVSGASSSREKYGEDSFAKSE